MNSDFTNTQVVDEENTQESPEQIREKRTRSAKYVLSALLAFTGVFILATQLAPLASSYIQGKILESRTLNIKNPTPQEELSPDDSDLPYYDPGVSYFQNLIEHIGVDGEVAGAAIGVNRPRQQQNVTVDKNYSIPMSIDIPSIGIKNVNITPNVDSFEEDVYNKALKNGLAHFQGTPLPGDGGNSFIYGHSAVDSFFSNHPDDPETIFSRLEGVEISDTFTIEKDGDILEYTIQKKKIAEPDDFDIVSGVSNKETVTLMTCWPLGIGSKRLVVIGELTDGK